MNKSKIIFYAGALILAGSLSFVHGAPITGSSENYEYLLGGEDFGKFSLGIYARDRTYKTSDHNGRNDYTMTMKKITGYIGYDVLRWMTVYGFAGATDTKFDLMKSTGRPMLPTGNYNGSETELGIGILMNLIDIDISDPTLEEDRIRVTACLEYTDSGIEHDNIDWNELYASMTFSLVNQIDGNKLFWPSSISFYVGPIYAQPKSSSLKNKAQAGFNSGCEFAITDKLTIDVGVERIQETEFVLGVNLKL